MKRGNGRSGPGCEIKTGQTYNTPRRLPPTRGSITRYQRRSLGPMYPNTSRFPGRTRGILDDSDDPMTPHRKSELVMSNKTLDVGTFKQGHGDTQYGGELPHVYWRIRHPEGMGSTSGRVTDRPTLCILQISVTRRGPTYMLTDRYDSVRAYDEDEWSLLRMDGHAKLVTPENDAQRDIILKWDSGDYNTVATAIEAFVAASEREIRPLADRRAAA